MRSQIPIAVRPGYPVSLGKLIQLEIDEKAEVLASVRQQIECCREDLSILSPKLASLSSPSFDSPGHRSAVLQGMATVHDYLEDALRHVVMNAVALKMLAVDADILGVYRCQGMKGEIALYWAVIGFIAKSFGLNAEDLAVVILAHELAHAYTHLGIDADGHQWSRFSQVGSDLAEALAQYYTHLALASYRDSAPGPWKAYQRLTDNQTQTYRHHLDWIDKWDLEVVRSTMLEARRHRFTGLEQFEPGLAREAKRIEN